MPRIMKCRHCHEVLVCSACGVHQTTVKENPKKSTSVAFTPDVLEGIDEEAQSLGISRSEYLERLAIAASEVAGENDHE